MTARRDWAGAVGHLAPSRTACHNGPILRFAANLTWLFTELPLPKRFQAAASAGFKGGRSCCFPVNIRLGIL